MDSCYLTLQTIYSMVKHDLHPESYLCSPREIIVRQEHGWDVIEPHLQQLVAEQMVVFKQLDALFICITSLGIEKAQAAAKLQLAS